MTRKELTWNVAIGIVLVIIGGGIWWYRSTYPQTFVVTEASVPVKAAESARTATSTATIVVHVTGAVSNPGIYQVPEGGRVVDAIWQAGGLAENADSESVNLAARCKDGQKIHVKSHRFAHNRSSAPLTKIHVNAATAEQLQLVPGIGPKLAREIVHHRNTYGRFTHLEQLTEVKGVKAKTFDSISPYLDL